MPHHTTSGTVCVANVLKQCRENIKRSLRLQAKVFFDRYMIYPKKFGKIAAAPGLANKSVADCIKFYYRTKKHTKYKEKREEMYVILDGRLVATVSGTVCMARRLQPPRENASPFADIALTGAR